MHKLLVVLAMFMVVPCLVAEDPHCKQVGGAISTNFLDASTTLGTATGDLKGGIGVSIASISDGPVFHNQHQWVTENGDTLFLEEADAAGLPTADPSLLGIRYVIRMECASLAVPGTSRMPEAVWPSGALPTWHGGKSSCAMKVRSA